LPVVVFILPFLRFWRIPRSVIGCRRTV
jgi:hypothetical protein